MQICKACKQELDETKDFQFSYARNKPYGECKDCRKIKRQVAAPKYNVARRRYRQKHPELVKKYRKAWWNRVPVEKKREVYRKKYARKAARRNAKLNGNAFTGESGQKCPIPLTPPDPSLYRKLGYQPRGVKLQNGKDSQQSLEVLHPEPHSPEVHTDI